jgi:hypothetical protein
VLLWLGLVVWSVWPVSPSGYVQQAVKVAEEAGSAVGTTIIPVAAELDGRLVPTLTSTLLDDAREAAATATEESLTVAPPDASAGQVRAELVPLLVGASNGITAVGSAVDDGDRIAMRAAADHLQTVQDDLDQFITDHR